MSIAEIQIPRPTAEFTEQVLTKRNLEHQKLTNLGELIREHTETMTPISEVANRLNATAVFMKDVKQGFVASCELSLDDNSTKANGGHLFPVRLPFFAIGHEDENGIIPVASSVSGYRNFNDGKYLESVTKTWLFAGFIAKNGLESMSTSKLVPVMSLETYSKDKPGLTMRVPREEYEIRYGSENRQLTIFERPDLNIEPLDWVDLGRQTPPDGAIEKIQTIDILFVKPLFESIKASYRGFNRLFHPVHKNIFDDDDGYQAMRKAQGFLTRELPVGDMTIKLPTEDN